MYTAISRVRKGEDIRMLCLRSQVKNRNLDSEYISVVNYVERRMLENTMPEQQRLELGPVPPDPPPPGEQEEDAPAGVWPTPRARV
jgi:hypothetical protein